MSKRNNIQITEDEYAIITNNGKRLISAGKDIKMIDGDDYSNKLACIFASSTRTGKIGNLLTLMNKSDGIPDIITSWNREGYVKDKRNQIRLAEGRLRKASRLATDFDPREEECPDDPAVTIPHEEMNI